MANSDWHSSRYNQIYFALVCRRQGKRDSKRKLRADKELADAIKRGDTKTVARIIKRNKEYKGLNSSENDKHCC